MEVSEIRSLVATQRKVLLDSEIATWSRLACERLISHSHAQESLKGKRISLYWPMRGEPQLDTLATFFAQAGARLHYPRMDQDSGLEMVEIPFDRIQENLEQGPFQFQQPKASLPAVSPDQLDVIIVPGVAFGRQGERIGRGKGHYDRYLAHCPQAKRLAIAFDFQLFPILPQNSWDQKVHWIFTQNHEICLSDENSLFR